MRCSAVRPAAGADAGVDNIESVFAGALLPDKVDATHQSRGLPHHHSRHRWRRPWCVIKAGAAHDAGRPAPVPAGGRQIRFRAVDIATWQTSQLVPALGEVI